MKRFALVLLIPVCFAECPPNILCKSTLTRHSCPQNTYYREGKKSHNCCPDCVPLKGLDETCASDEECAPGLFCPPLLDFDLERRCIVDASQECDYYKRVNEDWIREQYWKPDCLPNGKYAAKQCKGGKLSGKCFCTNKDGARIFGEAPWTDADDMTCACSREVEILRRTHNDLSLHCDEHGNYEALQCNDGVCWCANERNGIPYTPVVPESMTRILPCFEEKNYGSQYLRQCDSSHVNTVRAVKILKNHGFTDIILPKVNCNYDGSYARLQFEGAKNYCVFKDKNKLCSAFNRPADRLADCNCLYDKFVALKVSEENEFNFECDDWGGYKPQQSHSGTIFKVDSDGIIYNITKL